ncbi:MAG: SIS domain-containing protein [Alphaproteobacteria bacterium]|nr:SIS domain-containing protein [Alphaproteobacteria bacterium]
MTISETFFDDEFAEHASVLARTHEACRAEMQKMLSVWAGCVRRGGKILFFGNGGSAGDAQHLATELSVRYKKDRAPIASLALTVDTSTLTAAGNDLGFENIFARQVAAIGRAGDVAVGISTSGKSPNVTKALEVARDKGLTAAAFAGRDGGDLVGLADPLIIVPSETTARIQEMHILIGQILCGALEIELGLVSA